MIGVSVPPAMDEALRRHVAALNVSLTDFVRGLISRELHRAGYDTTAMIAGLGEGRGKRNDFDDDRRARALAQLADARKARRAKAREKRVRLVAAERALPAPHAAAIIRAVEAEEEAHEATTSPRRFREIVARVLAEISAREKDADAANADEAAS